MRKTLLVVVAVIILGLAGAWVVTFQALGTTQQSLQITQSNLNQTQSFLQSANQTLEETQQKLTTVQTDLLKTRENLEQTEQRLVEQTAQTEKHIQLNQSNEQKIKSQEQELAASQQSRQKLQRQLDETQKSLQLYQDTLGTQVFSGLWPPYLSGDTRILTLINNATAKNPTWKDLEAFLLADKTDKKLYVPRVYECGNFARDLHNNAEAKGIRAAFVAVRFQNGPPHALNAFKTLDAGLVYVDCTGTTHPIELANLDLRVQLKKGEPYRASLLFPGEGWGLDLPDYPITAIEIYW